MGKWDPPSNVFAVARKSLFLPRARFRRLHQDNAPRQTAVQPSLQIIVTIISFLGWDLLNFDPQRKISGKDNQVQVKKS